MKKFFILSILFLFSIVLVAPQAFASTAKKASTTKTYTMTTTCGHNGKVTPKSVGAGALSLIIWPGIGQLMNDGDNVEKAATHAVIGLFPLFRIWSCYDGVVDRKGGVWGNRI